MLEQEKQPKQAREELERIFPQWLVSAAENRDISIGQAMKFSPKMWLFPDFSFRYDDQDFVVPLIVDFDSLVNDLLAHQPGAFHYPGATLSFPNEWEDLSYKQIQDCLWHALEGWFYYIEYYIGSAVDWRKYERGQVPGDLRIGCLFEAFSSSRPNLPFLLDPLP
ncbi:hypothetical protein [Corynebacterium glutamicum]|uniref:hypothetical protein n=1 Tax=Corynebacterium glutamicum TaxID=1718 RepID=UPI0009436122|nr:hypothetical protein [Corynebacterium glutamicum]OKX81745.1 hypothetical protein AUO95_08160 [Corynebacterium glutamicum]